MASAVAATAPATKKNGMPWGKVITFPFWAPFYLTYKIPATAWGLVKAGWNHKVYGLIGLAALYVLVLISLMLLGKMGPESRAVLGNPFAFSLFLLKGMFWLIADVWSFWIHFWSQTYTNMDEMSRNPGTGNIVLDAIGTFGHYTIGLALSMFVAFCQTVPWWAWHGACARLILSYIGVGIIGNMLAPAIVTLEIPKGGGGHGGGGGGGGHH